MTVKALACQDTRMSCGTPRLRMYALTSRFVSSTAGIGLVPGSSLAPDFFDEFGYLPKHLVRILLGVALLHTLDRRPPPVLVGSLQFREVLRADDDGDRFPVLFDDDRFLRLAHGPQEVG